MQFIVLGHPGSDAGYWVIGSDGQLHHVGGWGVEQLTEVQAALSIIRSATQLKTPGLAQEAIRSVQKFAETQLADHVKGQEGGIIIIGG